MMSDFWEKHNIQVAQARAVYNSVKPQLIAELASVGVELDEGFSGAHVTVPGGKTYVSVFTKYFSDRDIEAKMYLESLGWEQHGGKHNDGTGIRKILMRRYIPI